MQLFSKEYLIEKFKQLAELGWVKNGRFGNHGGIGNTIEDYLGIAENNLPIANAGEWELKTQRATTTSLVTLFHMEPSPRAVRFIPKVLLPTFGWKHQEAGQKYPANEKSFNQTIHALSHSDRGFIVQVDRNERKVMVSFDVSRVAVSHAEWLEQIKAKKADKELDPKPYWGFDDLEHKAGTKLTNCFFVQAEVKTEDKTEYYWYNKVLMLQRFKFEGLLEALETGVILVDLNARTRHNHGTKFRIRQNLISMLYEEVSTIV
jgi:hypothetical protein